MTYLEKINALNGNRRSEWSERICSEISYLDGLSKYDKRVDLKLLGEVVDMLFDGLCADGAITNSMAMKAEEKLMPLSGIAKSYTEYYISHAHIDMNWMWGYNETVNVTADTFRTILNLMREYPEFTFAQSQASTYEIIDKYRHDMIDEIKMRIAEGRWEVTAAEWVEPDKNMPDGESLTRQILQSKKYLSKLLDIPASSLDLDFVPDTFGHNINVPEILASAGIKYMYHCRGYNGPHLYKYVAPSGKSTINYCEIEWYNGEISTEKFEKLPEFCGKYNIDCALVVYGVGDHGGGPSRRDIERIIRYKSWPLTPDIRFGTFHDFFAKLETMADTLPDCTSEMNYLFTGCYTTQTRIKMANRIAEARINDAEKLAAFNEILTGKKTSADLLDNAWRNILFNHFHDIIPGSGTIETREFALGRFQEAMGYITTSATKSMNEISDSIDTSGIVFANDNETTSEGSGVGYFQSQNMKFDFPSTERGRGSTRVYTLFNTTQYDRDEVMTLTVWDYQYGYDNIEIKDANGNNLEFEVTTHGNGYWGHSFTTINVKVKIKAFGYTTIILAKKSVDGHVCKNFNTYEHTDDHVNDDNIVLENKYIRASFDHKTMSLVSLTSKESGEELISTPSCNFTLIHENPIFGMTAWRIGPTMSTNILNETQDARLEYYINRPLMPEFSYYISFGTSRINCKVYLKKDSKYLNFDIRVDWHELPAHGNYIPQLRFNVPVSYKTNGHVRTDIPFGEIDRKVPTMDIPCLSYMQVMGESENKVAVISDTKYGYRFEDNAATVTLIRSSYDPDPYPENGIHNINLAVAACKEKAVDEITKTFNHPISFVSCGCHGGTLPLEASAIEFNGNAIVSAIKPSEDGEGIALRAFSESDKDEKISFSLYNRDSLKYVDVNAVEDKLGKYKNAASVDYKLGKFASKTTKIKL